MTTIPKFAPGCYGSALAFDIEQSVCRRCAFATSCQTLHQENLAALRARFGIVAKPKPAAPPPEADKINPATMMLPKKVREHIERIERAGIKITDKLRAGENPFPTSGFAFLRVACHLLLNLPKPVDQKLLTFALEAKLNWRHDLANAHARMALQVLTHVGAVDELEGKFVLRRT